MQADTGRRLAEHPNAFGFLRLLFASLVIVSHVPEIVDNDAHREILHRLTGVGTFGGFAVSGFFLISGYLITSSLLGTRGFLRYLRKRVARIYPGFVAASIISLAIVAPLSGAAIRHGPIRMLVASIVNMAVLARPLAEHPFQGQHYSDAEDGLNGAMWTIQYEFACYLLIALLGQLKLVRRPVVLALAIAFLAVGTWLPPGSLAWLSHSRLFPGRPSALFEMVGMFFSGSAWYLYRDRIVFRPVALALAAVALAAALTRPWSADFGYALFGGYLIFGIARLGAASWLARINNRSDISYGVYLYAWPAEQLLIRYAGSDSLVLLGVATWLVAVACGWLSWTFVEKPALKLVQ